MLEKDFKEIEMELKSFSVDDLKASFYLLEGKLPLLSPEKQQDTYRTMLMIFDEMHVRAKTFD